MGVKEYLKQVHWIDDEIKSLKDEYEAIFSKTLRTTSFNDMKVQSSPVTGIEDVYGELAEYAERIKHKSIELVRLKMRLSDEIENVEDDRLRRLLRYRYTIGFSWEVVSEHLGYDLRYIHRLHGYALQAFAKANPEADFDH